MPDIFLSYRRQDSSSATGRLADRLEEHFGPGRVFRDHDDIVAHCCHHWNRLIDQPWRIMSLGMRDWAHRF